MGKKRQLPTGPLRPAPPVPALTPREREVAGWLGEDLAYAKIANRLGVTDHVIRKHARSIQLKLGVHSRHATVAKLVARDIPVLIRVLDKCA